MATEPQPKVWGAVRPCEACGGTGTESNGDYVRHCSYCDGTGIYSEGKDLPDDELFLQSLAQRDSDVTQLEAQVASQQREIERLQELARRAATTIKVLLDAANTLAVLQGSLVKSPETEAFIDALRKAGGGTGNE